MPPNTDAPMAITRHFLGTLQPALASAADYLIHRYASGHELDLSKTLVVLPSGRASRRLLELLVQRGGDRWPGLRPPRILTFAAFPELLYPPRKPFADDFTQLLVWRQALFTVPHEALKAALPHPPDPDAIGAWTALCTTFRSQHRELAAEDCDFRMVADRLKKSGPAAEAARWEALALLQDQYHKCMDQLDLWDQQTARLEAVRRHECRSQKDILLVATVDISQVVCRMLDQVSDRVTALVHADESDAAGFDEYGGLRPEYWEQKHLDIPAAACRIAIDPFDQARQAVAAVAASNNQFRADQIALGVADETLVPVLLQNLDTAGTNGRWPVGKLLRQSAPWRLLSAVAAHLATAREDSPPDFDSLGDLVRHPDCSRWVRQHLQQVSSNAQVQSAAYSWLAMLDDYQAEHLQLTPGEFLGKQPRQAVVAEVCAAVDRLLATLLPNAADAHPSPRIASRQTTPTTPRSRQLQLNYQQSDTSDSVSTSTQLRPRRGLAEWSAGIVRLLQTAYEPSDESGKLAAGAAECLETLENLANQLQMLDQKQQHSPDPLLPRCSADQAIQLLLKQIADTAQSQELPDEGIDLVGWLDLPLDDSPLLVLTGFNEGAVPQSMSSDAFLPDSLRTRLKLKDNRFRYARDACAMHAILHSGRQLTIIIGRTTADGDPLSPSRLWFACDPDEVRRRVLRFYSDEPATDTAAAIESNPEPAPPVSRSLSRFSIPAPEPLPTPHSLSVTAFREYLDCPYRFYLRRELGLKFIEGNVREMSAPVFGTLIHTVLRNFGESSLKHAHEPEAIQELLLTELQQLARDSFGRTRSATVNVQLKMLENRLIAFSSWQAQTAREGWRIHRTEVTFKCTTFRDIKNRPVVLEGRIDRIDRHQQTGAWRVVDYKTGESAEPPNKTHRKKSGEWLDLQLPLYRLLANANDIHGTIETGYVQLPGDLAKIGFDPADWTDADLESAESMARTLAAEILDLKIDSVPACNERWTSDLSWICQDPVTNRNIPWAGQWRGRNG